MSKGSWKRGDFAGSAQRWSQGYTGAGPAITKGIAAPKRSPTASAVAAQDQLVSNFNQAVSSGRWAANLRRAGDQGWASGMTLFANSGLGTKATKGQPHFLAFAQQYGPAVLSQVQSLPQRGTFDQNQQRSAQLNQWAHQQKGKYKGAWRGAGGP